jgi:glycosyltransferase involved in cell wall biosynthesis
MTEPATDSPRQDQLNVLMISLSDHILRGEGGGDVLDRHIEYARRVAHIHMIVYSPLAHDLRTASPGPGLTVYPTRSRSRLTFPFDARRIGAQIIAGQQAAGHPIDVITTQDPFSTGLAGWWLKRRYGTPLNVQSHASFFDNHYWIGERPLRNGLFNRLGKIIARRADTMRVVNSDERRRAIGVGVAPEHVEVINAPVHVARFMEDVSPERGDALREELRIPAGAGVVLWVGRPVWFKQLPTMLEAFKQVQGTHPGAVLLLVGDMDEAVEDLPTLAAELGIADCVRFPGRIDHADLPVYFSLADVYALSSVYEGMPRVLIEAAAAGLPVVATAMAGGREAVIDGETGLLTELENPDDFAAKLSDLLGDPERARQMGRRARAHAAERFDRAATMDRIVALWARTAGLR